MYPLLSWQTHHENRRSLEIINSAEKPNPTTYEMSVKAYISKIEKTKKVKKNFYKQQKKLILNEF